jgi:hypothetical protein
VPRSRAKRLEVFAWNKPLNEHKKANWGRQAYTDRATPNYERMRGDYKKAARMMVANTPGMTAKDHLREAAHHSKQARMYLKRVYKWNEKMPWGKDHKNSRGAWRLVWRHREAARTHRLAAAYLSKKRLASNTRYYKRYRG